jgi:adenosylmethionine-8-amino-7-oxononanoate aminotransferase
MSVEKLLERFTVMYGPPKTTDERGFFREYIDAFEPFANEVIDRTATRILYTHQYKSWPSISECVKAAQAIRADLKAAQQTPLANRRKEREPLSQRQVREILAKHQDQVQRACREGWILGLVDFVRDQHRAPMPEERAQLRQNADFVQRAATGEEHLGLIHGGLVRLANAMLLRRDKLLEEMAE